MGSPKRIRRDQEKRVDIKDRLQALATKPPDSKKLSTSSTARTVSSARSQDARSGRDRNRLSDSKHSGRRNSPERSRPDGEHRWTKKLEEESKNPHRWGHSGFKELYKTELSLAGKARRSRSRERTSVRRSRSHDRSGRSNGGNREKSGGEDSGSRGARKRSHSSSGRSAAGISRSETDRKRPNKNGFAATPRSSGKAVTKKIEERRREERETKKERSSRKSLSPQRKDKSTSSKKLVTKSGKRAPALPLARSKASPVDSRRGRASVSDSSSSRSRSSLSASSSSSSLDSSSSSSSPERSQPRRPLTSKTRVPSNAMCTSVKTEDEPVMRTKLDGGGNKPHSSRRRKPTSGKRSAKSDQSSSDSSRSDSEDDMEEGEDDGEEGNGEGRSHDVRSRLTSSGNGHPVTQRLSLSERFGKLAQLSSQRRSLELVQLRIVAPVGGANSSEKNVSIDESKAAPIIFNSPKTSVRSRFSEELDIHHQDHHPINSANIRLHEEPIRPDDRSRDDRWRDWHEKYDQYRHIQPPRQLPRDWDDIHVRHKYYTDRGYFGHDMSLEDLSRWEDWWHRYQAWRRGYESAWVEMHGPNVPVEYPVEYRSTGGHHPRDPIPSHHHNHAHHQLSASSAAAPAPSIRSRLGWRR